MRDLRSRTYHELKHTRKRMIFRTLDNPEDDATSASVQRCVQLAARLVEQCDVALLQQLPIAAGFSNPARVKRARELAAQLSCASASSDGAGPL